MWFFLIVSWNGSVDVRHSFVNFEGCEDRRQAIVQQMGKTVRTVTPCIAVSLE